MTRTALRGARLGVIAWLLWLALRPADRGERYTEVERPVRLGPLAVAS